MTTFSDLEFGPHPEVEGGVISKKQFDNGYGIVVERYYSTDERGAILQSTLGAAEGLYQVGFTKNGEFFFEDPIPNDYVAVTEESIVELLKHIESLKPVIVISDDGDEEEISEDSNVMDFRHDQSFVKGQWIDSIEL